MKKKIALMLAAAGTAATMLPLFAAFEAHVINVTATIENALSVPVTPIAFGTVFPQEHLEKNLPITLSESFLRENRVDDVEYMIRQKPKCGWTYYDGHNWILVGTTQTGHVIPTKDNPGTPVDESNGGTAYTVDCGVPTTPAPAPTLGATWGMLPMLCPYLSKHERTEDGSETDNDESLNAFHHAFDVIGGVVDWNDTAKGRLSKIAGDVNDNWIIDLAVPCFGGYCAQDWATFVHNHNEDANPDEYVQDIANEHKVFGCDLWVEVTEVSEKPVPTQTPSPSPSPSPTG